MDVSLRLPSAVTTTTGHANFNSGPPKWNLSTAVCRIAHQSGYPDTTSIPQSTPAIRCNVDVYQVVSFVVKMVVLVCVVTSFHDLLLTGLSDIHEYFENDIKGPATFQCTTGRGCTFSEEAMDELITTFFGDPMITLQCESGECLHYSQVPGYVVSFLTLLVCHESQFTFASLGTS